LKSNDHELPGDSTGEGVRLQVWLARAGVASRRSAVELLQNGRIQVNGKTVCEPGARVDDTDDIRLDGRPLSNNARKVYYVLHKPSKFVCSTADEAKRDLALDLIQPFVKERLFTVGRLDYMTSGLLLLTNDGEWARHLSHPSSSVEKEYVVQTKKEIPVELLEEFQRGLRFQGEHFRCQSWSLTGPHTVRLVLSEGKNREIRKVFQSRNITVKRVHRMRIGIVVLKGLESGRFRKLTETEVKALARETGEPHGHRH
jgi:23S rRNA pseudouridine2605 synthase